jgi:hypothetical protein
MPARVPEGRPGKQDWRSQSPLFYRRSIPRRRPIRCLIRRPVMRVTHARAPVGDYLFIVRCNAGNDVPCGPQPSTGRHEFAFIDVARGE